MTYFNSCLFFTLAFRTLSETSKFVLAIPHLDSTAPPIVISSILRSVRKRANHLEGAPGVWWSGPAPGACLLLWRDLTWMHGRSHCRFRILRRFQLTGFL